jgi:predicted secreted protein
MSITAAVVLFAVIWFLVFFMVLPVRHVSQADEGSVVPGTPRGAPAVNVVGKKAKITTLIAFVVWAVVASILLSGWITIRDIDIMGVMDPRPAQD